MPQFDEQQFDQGQFDETPASGGAPAVVHNIFRPTTGGKNRLMAAGQAQGNAKLIKPGAAQGNPKVFK